MKASETPLMVQYRQMKAKHPDAVLLFRVGDFYETFCEDAITASEVLGITLTRRANGKSGCVELAGFPHHALDTYLPRLVRAGKRVAICEQLEDPKMGNKMVKREEIRPGIICKQEDSPKPNQKPTSRPQRLYQPSLFDGMDCCEPQADYTAIPQIKLSYVCDPQVRANPVVTNSQAIAKVIRVSYGDGEIELRESFKAVYLSQANKVLGIQLISVGGLTSTAVDAKLIYKGALLANAASVIIAHNHPSGLLRPSAQDDEITKRIAKGCKTLDLVLLDHIIVTAEGHYSYADNRRLP